MLGENIAIGALQLGQSQACRLGPEGHPSRGLGSAGACCSLSPGWWFPVVWERNTMWSHLSSAGTQQTSGTDLSGHNNIPACVFFTVKMCQPVADMYLVSLVFLPPSVYSPPPSFSVSVDVQQHLITLCGLPTLNQLLSLNWTSEPNTFCTFWPFNV